MADDDAPRITAHEADEIAARLLGQMRTRLGGLHIDHARRVAEKAAESGDERIVAAALLHDVLEKTAVTAEQLHDWTGDAKVMQLVDTLSHRDNESLQEYLARCAADPVAYFIKRLDLADKLDDTDDSTVPRRVARKIERETRERLALLDRLAGQKHDIRGNAS